jgi:uncharacterized membrane protein YhhN
MKNILPHNSGLGAIIAFVLAFLAGLSYFFVQNIEVSAFTTLIWKASGAWLLAIFAMLVAKNNDGWLLTAVLAISALGDVLFEGSFENGAGAFAVAYLIAIILYARNRRTSLTPSQRALGYSLFIAVPLMAWFLTDEIMVTAYAAVLGIMAGMAWMSRFPRYWTGMGAIMLVESELVTMARDVFDGDSALNYIIWGLYFTGQVLVTLGVTRTLSATSLAPLQDGQ